MSKAVSKEQEKFNTNSEPLLEVTYEKHYVLRIYEEQIDIMVL